jgi:probable DNA metabolism protein
MVHVRLEALNDAAEWRRHARVALALGIAPDDLFWREPGSPIGLMDGEALPVRAPRPAGIGVPPTFLDLAEQVLAHSDPARFSLLYDFLVRLAADRALMGSKSDPVLVRLAGMASAVRRDSHKMKAFVRFRQVEGIDREAFLAWFEPDHYVLERTAPFFMRRFAALDWGIVTPYRSARWDGQKLRFGAGGARADVPKDDAMEAAWKTYYASIFNPARLKVSAMKSEMPVKYWRNLPEAELIAPLVRSAHRMEQQMIETEASQPPSRHRRAEARKPDPIAPAEKPADLETVRIEVQSCKRCPLYEHATQAVFGEGPADADIVFVGEQPGDQEDLAGRPFVGPAGQVFDRSLAKVGIDRDRVYVTNAVKHFKFVLRGKRRLHQSPNAGEIAACRFWLDIELEQIKPRIVVALGASAAQSLLGRTATISKLRGAPITLDNGMTLFVTNHPSYLLRIPEPDRKAAETARFEADLTAIRAALAA